MNSKDQVDQAQPTRMGWPQWVLLILEAAIVAGLLIASCDRVIGKPQPTEMRAR